jgi:hypothetical protein
MSLEEIVQDLSRLGIEHAVLPSGDEGAVLMLPEYGRVLGLWPHWRAENALWVNPAFLLYLSIGSKDDGWLNPGGDFMLLAPEGEFFAEGPGSAPPLDPGQFVHMGDKGSYCMENRGEARAWKASARVRFRITRRIRPLSEPRLTEMWGTTYLRKVGYEEETALEIAGGCPVPVWLWNVTQVRPGAEVRVPLRKRSEAPGSHGTCEVMTLLGSQTQRVGIPVDEAAPRILCVEEQESGRAQLLVKGFESGGTRDGQDSLVECRWGRWDGAGEFSCTSPVVNGGGRLRIQWKTTLCAFSGRREEILSLCTRLEA